MITLTQSAQEQIKELQKKEAEATSLRLQVIGGGCSGLSYKIAFSVIKEKDITFTFEGFDVVIDPKSYIYLKDTTLDFQTGLNGKGFVFQNPTAKNTCGCGESFSI